MFPTILMALGFVNGLILGGILMNIKSKNTLATKLFAWVVLLFALSIGQELMEILGLHYQFPHILSSTDGFLLLIFPLLYLYALIIMGKKQRLIKKDLLHTLPFLAFTIHLLPYYSLTGYEKLNFQHNINFELLAYLKAIPIIIYLLLTSLLFFESSSNDIISNMTLPVLWVYGNEDRSHPARYDAAILENLNKSNFTIQIYPNANHELIDITTGQPIDFVPLLQIWLEENN